MTSTPIRMQPLALTLTLLCVFLGACSAGEGTSDTAPPAHNTLTAAEQEAGWQLLFDGETTDGWRGYNAEHFPERGWEVRDGSLVIMKSDGEEGLGGDIVTNESFESFELSIDFKVTPVANSGILYRVFEQPDSAIWHNAPEFQVLDDSAYVAMGTMDMHTHLTGDNYDLHASTVKASAPVGEWNTARIIVDGNHVEHWLNGQLTVEYDLLSPEWEELVSNSKFAVYEQYGRAPSGPIGLQDHGHEVWYRNMKILPNV